MDEAISRTTQLEAKLDALAASLKPGPTSQASTHVSDGTPPASYLAATGTANLPVPQPGAALTQPGAALTHRTISLGSATEILWDQAGVSIAQAEEHLRIFRAHHAKFLPFVDIPQTLTARQLHAEKPYLSQAIMATCPWSVSHQQRLGTLFRHEVGEAMVVRSEKSMDLLLGLLVFIGWCGELDYTEG